MYGQPYSQTHLSREERVFDPSGNVIFVLGLIAFIIGLVAWPTAVGMIASGAGVVLWACLLGKWVQILEKKALE